jgi:cob(I)alamin adenosyltransferase
MVKLNKIYTRTGDDGTTGLVDGSRRSKADLRMHAMGDVDETNSLIGVAIVAVMSDSSLADLAQRLTRIQNDLFDLGADIATPGDDFAPSEMVLRIVSSQVDWMEAAIDVLNGDMAPLTSFILPGGSNAAAALHVARAVSRRAERTMVALADVEPVNPAALAYINRLSDFLFVAARWINSRGSGDVLWVPGASR